ncbi:Putative inner membrane protein [Escherichia coli]|uniref:Inner membrane protein n=1 Tax=Escherichia coli TaxID=562 RepID=A0A2X1KCI4_ECOLX|nr:Putative inner membrane protein [Escherichia coli]
MIDVLIPSLGNSVYLVTIIGTLFALVGAIVTTIPEYRTSKTNEENGGIIMKDYLQTVTGPVAREDMG